MDIAPLAPFLRWWHQINHSSRWQDAVFYSLCAAYALVSSLALVSPSTFPSFSCVFSLELMLLLSVAFFTLVFIVLALLCTVVLLRVLFVLSRRGIPDVLL